LDSSQNGDTRLPLDGLFQELVGSPHEAVLLIDRGTSAVVACNDAAARMLRADDTAAVMGTSPWALSPLRQPDGRLSEEKFSEMSAQAERRGFHRFELVCRRMDGDTFPVEAAMTMLRLDSGEFLRLVLRDLSALRQADAARSRLQRARDLLAASSRVLTNADDEQELLGEMCRMAVETGGYCMAWVGYGQADSVQSIKPVASAGIASRYLDDLFVSWGDKPNGRGPTGCAMRSGKTQIAQDFQNNPQVAPWLEAARQYNLQSCIALPLKHGGSIVGTMTIYAEQVDAFDPEEVQVLEKMAAKLAYGVSALRVRQARRQAELGLDRADSLLKAALEATADGILVTSRSGDVEMYNQNFARMFNIQGDDARGRNAIEIMAQLALAPEEFARQLQEEHASPEQERDHVIEFADGRVIGCITRPHMLDGVTVGQVRSFRDISAQVQHEEQLRYHATHDALTGLPNRTLLSDRIGQAITRAQRSGGLLGVIFADIDRFKLVNDSMGHETGDALLVHTASVLSGLLRKEDTLARLGGDEFVILLENLGQEQDAARVAQNLLQALAEPVEMAGREILMTASLGIALFPRDGDDPAMLFRHAEAALYRAKRTGGNCLHFFLPEYRQDSQRKLELTTRLRRAIRENQMEVHYQPQLNLKEGRITEAEALLRWRHPVMGMISPVEFIPIAEETGVISELFAWTIKTVCADLAAWKASRLPEIRVGINVSPRQFESEDLPEQLRQLLAQTGTAPRLIELEITEGTLMQRPERAVSILNRLSTQGFIITMDDFGTGYSSLSYLMRFPVNKLKIDRSFIANIPESRDHISITRAVIAMAHELGVQAVAEGVETEAQKDFLAQHDCELVQGFLISRPVPRAELERLLAQQ
jgi:diguanylate cyclase (GGDEF)-like protein/PAS domain S-box-containing protein